MASTKKPNYSAKVKYWSDGITGECSGGIVGCIDQLFLALPRDKREKVISMIEDSHAKIIAWEKEKSAGITPPTK